MRNQSKYDLAEVQWKRALATWRLEFNKNPRLSALKILLGIDKAHKAMSWEDENWKLAKKLFS